MGIGGELQTNRGTMTKNNDENTTAMESTCHSFGDFGALLHEIPVGDAETLVAYVNDLVEYRDSFENLGIAIKRFVDRAIECLRLASNTDVEWEASISTAYKLLDAASFLPTGIPSASESPPESPPEEAEAQDCSVVVIEEDSTEYSVPTFTPDDQELVSEFVNESTEYLDEAESALLTLEEHPEDIDTIDTIFRCFHTIKGVAAFLGFEAVAALSHRAESLLSRARDKEIRLTGGYATLALQSVDNLKGFIDNIRVGEMSTLPPSFRRLMAILQNPDAHVSSENGSQAVSSAVSTNDGTADTSAPQEEPTLAVAVSATAVAPPQAEASTPPQAEVVLQVAASAGLSAVDKGSAEPSNEPAKASTAPKATEPKATAPKATAPKATAQKVEATVRVRTDRLDRLIDAVGELVIAQSMVTEDPLSNQIGLQKKVIHAGKIIRDLQDMTLALRMVPLKATMQKMSRVVRDVARKQSKRVELVTEGSETEIDRGMVDVISDPLVHMVRNSVDHGIESEAERVAAGKPPVGQIMLSAKHSQGSVVVSLVDDGKGLDRKKIASKAISQGIIESDEGMTDSDVFRLIFSAGFSTAEVVTDVSGRGVGMDVVRRAIESLKGSIDIRSVLGQGTTFDIRLPLTLAITDGMLVKVGAQRYIIPTVNIVRSLRPLQNELSSVTGCGELVSLRGEQVPIYRLHEIYGVEDAQQDPTKALLVIVSDGDRMAAIMVDSLLGKQQAVTKSLGEGIGNIPGVSGGAILGDGRVGLILDPNTLIAFARESGKKQQRRTLAKMSGNSQMAAMELL